MKKGYFGDFGGQFIPELLMPPLIELEEAMQTILPSEEFQTRFIQMLKENVGRPSALTYCRHMSEDLGLDLWLKREDLNHSGAHKINNTLGQGLLAKMMGKEVLLAETGAGMHGVATTVAAAMLDMKAVIYMGAEDVVRQAPNVNRMRLMGAEIVAVESGTRTLKDAINEAMRRWLADQENTHYCFGTAAGPHPFPELVREFQQVISKEARQQFMDRTDGALPDVVVACVGGGSNAIGMFHHFVPDASVKLIGVEAAGTGEPGCDNSAPLNLGSSGVLHGMKTKLLQTDAGQIMPSHSVAPGLDYPGVGPEHAHLQDIGRAQYVTINDNQALNAFVTLSRREGIIPALESSHAVAYAIENKDALKGQSVLVNLSGRGDKDLGILDRIL
ncbi:tryptophan synthase subunit beta [Pseudodesulfovibrio sp. JC047]|uniref:tryptophan synthase subunit beta n=1 Tax=Pseudodesulfovibrio sp. JC047 TaxID=2683199 RepID=UPI0013D2B292|nr:tryptophan synthase subunit beta [Pseudodesulfovibrio sp. JC047]NDV19390.1 tryptophan synthase subunit beta [Pseudodesulfovibrio sp. JC047]